MIIFVFSAICVARVVIRSTEPAIVSVVRDPFASQDGSILCGSDELLCYPMILGI